MSYTLTLTFTPSVPPAPFGYRITYWPVSNPLATTSVIVPNSPYTITGLTEEAYAGTVETQCELGVFTNPVSWGATHTVPSSATLTFYNYSVNCDGPPASTFEFQLTPAITENITVTYASVELNTNAVCKSTEILETDELVTSATIPAGSTGVSVNGDSPMCCNEAIDIYAKYGSYIQVSGVLGFLTDGSTFTTPLGTVVTVVIPSGCYPVCIFAP